ncbi:MAG: TonB-dependent receptor [Candidatus Eisenbacteria bacterium]|nr:TonB-dependent receptor [Candidatus Eisenbacteria bacterium]
MFGYTTRRVFMLFAAIVLLLSSTRPSEAQQIVQATDNATKIIGRITSDESGEPLAYANVVLYKVASAGDSTGTAFGGGMTANDGTYRIAVPPGFYRMLVGYVGYHQKKVGGIEVTAGRVVNVDIALRSTAMKLETVEVTATVDRATESAILAKQKTSAAVSDGVSVQQIKKTPDSNAADVMRRVTGVSLVGDRYVFVRGLGERYSSTQVNGNAVSSPEANKKVIPLDMFASGLLDNVVVQKTYTPDQPGEFSGGVVNLSTRDFPGQKIWEFSFNGAYHSSTTGESFYNYEGSSTDFLAFDDGLRDVPGKIGSIAHSRKVTPRGQFGGAGFGPDTMQVLGQSLRDDWKTKKGKIGPAAYGMSATYGNELSFRGQPLGVLGSFALTNKFSTVESEENSYEGNAGSEPRTDYHVTNSEMNVLWGAVGNLSYRLNPFNTLSMRTMYNRSAEDETQIAEGFNNDFSRNSRHTRYRYIERGIFTGSAGMKHNLTRVANAVLDWKFSYASAERNEPDRREFSYEENFDIIVDEDDNPIDTLQTYVLSGRVPPRRHFGEMSEEDRGWEANLAVPFHQWSGLESKIRFGVLSRNRDRDFRWRRFKYEAPTSIPFSERTAFYSQAIEDLLSPENIGHQLDHQRKFLVVEETGTTDAYLASQDTRAAYAMVDLPLNARFRSVIGARMERAELRNRTFDQFSILDAETARVENTDLLPSLNVTWSPTEKVNVRAAFSRTVSRPDLRELSEFQIQDVTTQVKEVGNPELKRARITNLDLRWESFLSSSELLAASVFFKDFDDPIERTVLNAAEPLYKPVNGEEATLYGTELEARLALGRVAPRFESLSLAGNLTLVESEAKLDELSGSSNSNQRPLEGQSPYVLNTSLYYNAANGRTSAALLYNVFGRRLYRVGLQETPDIYEEPRTTIDATVSHKFRRGRMKLSLTNLLDEESKFRHDGAGTVHVSRKGRGVSLSFSTGS